MKQKKINPTSFVHLLVYTALGIGFYFFMFALDKNAVASADNAVKTQCETEVAGTDDDIITIEGKRVKILNGDVYICSKGDWNFDHSMVRPGYHDIEIRKTIKGCEVTNKKSGEHVVLNNPDNFSSDFEVDSFLDLFNEEDWSMTTLLSPKARKVRDYVKLNKKIMKGGEFLDNRIDLETENVHSGKSAIRFSTVDPGFWMKTVKSLVEKNNLCFAKGDDLWFSGWYYVKEGMPSTILDFETRRFKYGPGIRLFIRNKKYASMELKFGNKPQYNQTKVEFPRNRWVNIRLHMKLSNYDDGLIEMWQDGKKILSTNGQTLPTHDTTYNVMQVGITATPRSTVLIVDDVVLSSKPIQ